MVVPRSRVCFVRVLRVLALLERGLGPPAWFARGRRFACVLRVFRDCERVRVSLMLMRMRMRMLMLMLTRMRMLMRMLIGGWG